MSNVRNMRRVLVTGASGFIGRHSITKLLDKDTRYMLPITRNPSKSGMRVAFAGTDATSWNMNRTENSSKRSNRLTSYTSLGIPSMVSIGGQSKTSDGYRLV